VSALRRRLPALLLLLAAGVLPWGLWLAAELPSRHVAEHWDVVWGGFDGLLSMSLVATAAALARRHRLAQGAAAASAALLVADAWFDVTTSAGGELAGAIALAVCAELPIAALLVWLALDPSRGSPP
jgi:hypothetical protein